MGKKYIIVAGGVAAVILGLIILSLVTGGKPAPQPSPAGIPGAAPEAGRPFTFLPLEPFVTPLPSEEPSILTTPFAARPPSAAAGPPAIPDYIQQLLQTVPQAPTTAPLPGVTPKVLSEAEIFERVWPKEYLDQLLSSQDYLAQQGVVKEENRISLDSTENIIAFLSQGIDYLVAQKALEQSVADGFKKGLAEQFRDRKLFEEKTLRQYGGTLLPQPSPHVSPSISPQSRNSSPEFITLGSAIRKIVGKAVSGVVDVKEAQSFFSPFPWSCWQNLKPGVPGCVGVTLWAPICWGFLPFITPIPIGCLNAVCPFGNAIWDFTTGLCGCDQWFSFCGIPF